MVAGTATASLAAAGGLVLIGGALHATRPVQESYALVRVPGVANVRAYVSNQVVGPHEPPRQSAGAEPALVLRQPRRHRGSRRPIEFGLTLTGATVAPPYRGGALVTFPVQRGQRSTGIILLRKGAASAVPAYGKLTLTAGAQTVVSPIGARGEFYLDAVPPGRSVGVLEFRGTVCRVPIAIPQAAVAVAPLGTIVCTADDKEP